MTTDNLIFQIKQKQSFLCVGLDIDKEKLPKHFAKDNNALFNFSKEIINATHDLCIAYKPNLAFYEAYGLEGYSALKETIFYIKNNYPNIFLIADAKRCDIGNTATRYAKAFFEELPFHAITVSPYMGKDSIEPFLEFKDKFTVLLALTSNEGAYDFQTLTCENGKMLFENVIETSTKWKNSENLMYVVGATKPEYFKLIRKYVPNNFLLVPGVGAQGGSLDEVCKYGAVENVKLIVNSSREILYASSHADFALAARKKALEIKHSMEKYI